MGERQTVLNAFRPNGELENPGTFAGRRDLILDLTDSLQKEGSCPVIYGERGLGKSSLALQAARIALGDTELLVDMRKPERGLDSAKTFIPFWVSCTKEIRDKNALLQRIINTAETHDSLMPLAETKLQGKVDTHKLKLPFYEGATKRKYERTLKRSFTRLSVEEKLLLLSQQILESGAPGVLFVIDELDRVQSTDGLADFIKNASSERVKFLLVGVGQSVSTLIGDHESTVRKLDPTPVSPMTPADLRDIVGKTMGQLRKKVGLFEIAEPATELLVEAAGGYPWFVHSIGQEALIRVYDEERRLVEIKDVNRAIDRLSERKFAQHYSDLYHQAVGASPQREMVLRIAALWNAYDVSVSDVFKIAKQLGVTNPSSHKKALLQKKNGQIIMSKPNDSGKVRFRNGVFKRYVCLRGSIHPGVRQQVIEAWREHRRST
jgi:hypothetical protein